MPRGQRCQVGGSEWNGKAGYGLRDGVRKQHFGLGTEAGVAGKLQLGRGRSAKRKLAGRGGNADSSCGIDFENGVGRVVVRWKGFIAPRQHVQVGDELERSMDP